MRILQIHNKYLEQGGEDTVVANERAMLQENGHEVLLCEFDNKDLEGHSTFNVFCRTIFNRKSYKRLSEILETFQPDVAHIHNVYYEASSAVFFALKKKGVPAVMTIHNYRFGCIQSLLYREGKVCELCLGKKSAFNGIKHKCFQNSYAKSLHLALINSINRCVIKRLNPIKKFIFLSEFIKDVLTPILELKNTEGVIKPNFIQDYGYATAESREDFYLFVGRLNQQKGIDILIDIFTKNNKKLHIIGTGPLEDFVKETVKSHPNIHYLGFADKHFIVDKLKKCKALIVPSITYEGQPMTIIEAFSTGTPVFASNIKNLNTFIQDGENGFLFTPENINARFDSFEKLNTIEKTTIYDNARAEYEKKFSPQSNCQLLTAIYKTVIYEKGFQEQRPIVA
jgi:glycosyltransferase involved in cell wall biosynthesis